MAVQPSLLSNSGTSSSPQKATPHPLVVTSHPSLPQPLPTTDLSVSEHFICVQSYNTRLSVSNYMWEHALALPFSGPHPWPGRWCGHQSRPRLIGSSPSREEKNQSPAPDKPPCTPTLTWVPVGTAATRAAVGSGVGCRESSRGPACPLSFSSRGTIWYGSTFPAGTYPRCPVDIANVNWLQATFSTPLREEITAMHGCQCRQHSFSALKGHLGTSQPPPPPYSLSLPSACTPPVTGSSFPPEAARSVLNTLTENTFFSVWDGNCTTGPFPLRQLLPYPGQPFRGRNCLSLLQVPGSSSCGTTPVLFWLLSLGMASPARII